MTAADDELDEWPEPTPHPHLSPLRTAGEIVDDVLLFSPLGLVASVGVIAVVEAWRAATGTPPVTAILNGVLAFVLILVVGAAGAHIERGRI